MPRSGWNGRRLDARVRDARRASERGRESLRVNPRATPGLLPLDVGALDRAVDSLEHIADQCRSDTATLLDMVSASAKGSRRPTPEFLQRYTDVLDEVATAFAALGDEVTGDDEVQKLRSAVSDDGDKWRDLRGLVQNAEVQSSDSFPAYGSLLVDAEGPWTSWRARSIAWPHRPLDPY